MLFKNSARISKRTPHFTITNINLLTLVKEVIAEKSTETVNGNSKLLTAKTIGTFSYHSALKGYCNPLLYICLSYH
jgi:hypothetical protein